MNDVHHFKRLQIGDVLLRTLRLAMGESRKMIIVVVRVITFILTSCYQRCNY